MWSPKLPAAGGGSRAGGAHLWWDTYLTGGGYLTRVRALLEYFY